MTSILTNYRSFIRDDFLTVLAFAAFTAFDSREIMPKVVAMAVFQTIELAALG